MNEPATITVIRSDAVSFCAVQGDGATGLSLARLYQNPERALTFQIARIGPGGVSRRHAHPWEQVNLVSSGTGIVDADGQQIVITPGDCVILPGNVSHAITNTGDEPLFLVSVLGPGAT